MCARWPTPRTGRVARNATGTWTTSDTHRRACTRWRAHVSRVATERRGEKARGRDRERSSGESSPFPRSGIGRSSRLRHRRARQGDVEDRRVWRVARSLKRALCDPDGCGEAVGRWRFVPRPRPGDWFSVGGRRGSARGAECRRRRFGQRRIVPWRGRAKGHSTSAGVIARRAHLVARPAHTGAYGGCVTHLPVPRDVTRRGASCVDEEEAAR